MKKKVAVKAKPAKKAKEIKAPVALKADSGSSIDQIKTVISHMLELFKASLLDGFRQWVKNKMANDLPALIDDFIDSFKQSYALHGISKEQLVAVLDDYEQEYVKLSSKPRPDPVELEPLTPVENVVVKETNVKSVFSSLDVL